MASPAFWAARGRRGAGAAAAGFPEIGGLRPQRVWARPIVLLDIYLINTYIGAARSPQERTTHHGRNAGSPPSIARRRRLACAGAASCIGARSKRGIN